MPSRAVTVRTPTRARNGRRRATSPRPDGVSLRRPGPGAPRVRLADGGFATAGDPLERSSAARTLTPLDDIEPDEARQPSRDAEDRQPHAPARRGPGRATVIGGFLVAALFAVAGVVIAAAVDDPTTATAVPAAGVAEVQTSAAFESSPGRQNYPSVSPTVGADVGAALGGAAVVSLVSQFVLPPDGLPEGTPTGGPTTVLPLDAAESGPEGIAEPPAPATVSTLSAGDPGFGWPTAAFGTAAGTGGN